MLLFLDRGDHHDHPLALQLRHLFGLAEFLELKCETQQQFLTLLGEEDRASAEEYIGLDLGAFLQETLGVVELELIVVLVGLRAETDFLDDHLRRIGFLLLRLLFLLIDEFLIVNDLAHGRLGVRGDLNQIQFPLLSHLQCLCNRINTLFGYIVTHNAHARSGDGCVDAETVVLVLAVLRQARIRLNGRFRSGFRGSVLRCYGRVLLRLNG